MTDAKAKPPPAYESAGFSPTATDLSGIAARLRAAAAAFIRPCRFSVGDLIVRERLMPPGSCLSPRAAMDALAVVVGTFTGRLDRGGAPVDMLILSRCEGFIVAHEQGSWAYRLCEPADLIGMHEGNALRDVVALPEAAP